jgi:hypothetical protein
MCVENVGDSDDGMRTTTSGAEGKGAGKVARSGEW